MTSGYRHIRYLTSALAEKFGTSRSLVGVEVGVWRGDNSEHLLLHFPLLTLLLVDPYLAYALDDKTVRDQTFKEQHNLDEAKLMALEKLAVYGERFTLLQTSSQRAAFECAQNLYNSSQFDFVFIDAHHSYESVKMDIGCWYPLVKNGGVLCGHDYRQSHLLGVKPAVDEFVAQGSFKLNRVTGHIWWVEKS